MSEELNLAVQTQTAMIGTAPVQLGNVWVDPQARETAWKAAVMLSKCQFVPGQYQGKPEDCFVACDIANRMGMPPLMVLQNLYVVKGKPAWSGQFCMALIRNSGKYKAVRCVYTGKEGTDERGCHIEAVEQDGTIVEGVKVTMAMAKGEGWLSNPKWKNMPDLMMSYRAASFFAKVNCAEMMAGFQTVEEMDDVAVSKKTRADRLNNALNAEV